MSKTDETPAVTHTDTPGTDASGRQPYQAPRLEDIGTIVSHTSGSGVLAADEDTGVSTPTGR